jgi:hypothetical protein
MFKKGQKFTYIRMTATNWVVLYEPIGPKRRVMNDPENEHLYWRNGIKRKRCSKFE